MLDYHARYYDATLGRFISPDSVVPDYANPQDLNRYSYVRGNPVRFTDPSGHWLFEDTPDDPSIWYDKPDEFQNTLVRGKNADSFANWDEMQPGSIWAPVKAFAMGGLVYFGATEFLATSAGTAIEDGVVWALKRMMTRQFMLRAGVSGTAGVAGDVLGQVGFSVNNYNWRRVPGVFVPNALGGGWLGEGYDVLQGGNLAMRAARIGAAGAANVLVSGGQRCFTNEQNSLNVAESDFRIGVMGGLGGEAVFHLLTTRTSWSGVIVENISSFFTHTNIISAIEEKLQLLGMQE